MLQMRNKIKRTDSMFFLGLAIGVLIGWNAPKLLKIFNKDKKVRSKPVSNNSEELPTKKEALEIIELLDCLNEFSKLK